MAPWSISVPLLLAIGMSDMALMTMLPVPCSYLSLPTMSIMASVWMLAVQTKPGGSNVNHCSASNGIQSELASVRMDPVCFMWADVGILVPITCPFRSHVCTTGG